jgi:hypothetical protein
LVTNEFDDIPQVLFSDLSQRRNVQFLKVQLVGTTSNRGGLGAVVRVKAGNRQFSRYLHAKSGYLAQSDLPLYFGLGEDAASEVQVKWPSGRSQTLPVSLRNGLVRVEEPAN